MVQCGKHAVGEINQTGRSRRAGSGIMTAHGPRPPRVLPLLTPAQRKASVLSGQGLAAPSPARRVMNRGNYRWPRQAAMARSM